MFSVSGMRGAGKMRDPGNEVGNEESGRGQNGGAHVVKSSFPFLMIKYM